MSIFHQKTTCSNSAFSCSRFGNSEPWNDGQPRQAFTRRLVRPPDDPRNQVAEREIRLSATPIWRRSISMCEVLIRRRPTRLGKSQISTRCLWKGHLAIAKQSLGMGKRWLIGGSISICSSSPPALCFAVSKHQSIVVKRKSLFSICAR